MNQTEWPYFTNRSRPTNHDQPMPLESCSQQHHSRTDQSVYTNWTYTIWLTTTVPLTLMMTSAQVVEMSVTTTNNSPSQDYTHPDDQSTLWHFPGVQTIYCNTITGWHGCSDKVLILTQKEIQGVELIAQF